MLYILTHDILPVFSLLALGFVMGRARTVSWDEARALNRVAFLVLQPPLIFKLLYGLDPAAMQFGAIGIYALCEVLGFLTGYAVARFVFGRGHLESWLLGMAVIFVNSLLYILPISQLIYGTEASVPVAAIVALDSSLTFGFFIISMEFVAGDRAAGSLGPRLARNPVLWAIGLALTLNLGGFPLPEPFLTAASFAGAATAPVTLFALGVVLSATTLVPTPVVAGITALKLLGFPALVFGMMALVWPGSDWSPFLVLNAAGPSGAMAFALALLYGVRTEAIAPVIVWTSALSLLSLAWLA